MTDKHTLASQGIDKNLAHQARQLGAPSEEEFEQTVQQGLNGKRVGEILARNPHETGI